MSNAVKVVDYGMLKYKLEDYYIKGIYNDNEMVTGDFFEKLVETYGEDKLIGIQAYMIHNRVFYYLRDILDFIIRNPNHHMRHMLFRRPTSRYKVLAKVLEAKALEAGLLSTMQVSELFRLRLRYAALNISATVKIGKVSFWSIEDITKELKRKTKLASVQCNSYLLGITGYPIVESRLNKRLINAIVTYRDNELKESLREACIKDIYAILDNEVDLSSSKLSTAIEDANLLLRKLS